MLYFLRLIAVKLIAVQWSMWIFFLDTTFVIIDLYYTPIDKVFISYEDVSYICMWKTSKIRKADISTKTKTSMKYHTTLPIVTQFISFLYW